MSRPWEYRSPLFLQSTLIEFTAIRRASATRFFWQFGERVLCRWNDAGDRTCLAKIKALRDHFPDIGDAVQEGTKAAAQIARELNVDAVIEGSGLRSGDRVRIAAQLIHAATDRHLWAESYERDFRDILSVQSEIARRIADAIKVMLTPEERAQLTENRKVDPEAHELYFKARYHWNKRTEESIKKAIGYFHPALDCDPAFAKGYAGLADAYQYSATTTCSHRRRPTQTEGPLHSKRLSWTICWQSRTQRLARSNGISSGTGMGLTKNSGRDRNQSPVGRGSSLAWHSDEHARASLRSSPRKGKGA